MSSNHQVGSASAANQAPRVVPTSVEKTGNLEVMEEDLAVTSEGVSQVTTVKDPNMSARSNAPAPRRRESRHAHLFLTHIDPWSVMKNAFMLSIALGIVMIVAVTILWGMFSVSGTLDSIARAVTDVSGSGPQAIDVREIFSFSKVVGTTSILAGVEVVLTTALITLFAFLYNLAVGITGGLQVTLTDDS